jgi:radical SAM superfamily enzyme YgiQ (UPF0313 family)
VIGSLPPAIRPLLSAPDALIAEADAGLGNPGWDEASSRILVVRLSPFEDVDRSSPHLVLFAECRAALPGAFLDFAFFPDRQDREILAERRLPFYYGLSSSRSPASFDLVMVSVSFGLELVNLPYLFSTAGLGLSASERAATRASGRESPIVILGGSSVAAAGALSCPDGGAMVDGFFFGEGEEAIGELAAILSARLSPVAERLERARRIEGFWIPGSGNSASGETLPSRRVARPFPRSVHSYPILNSDESATARLQISAGCPGLCSFCLEGWDRRPYRELPLARLITAAKELRASSGADTLEVYSFNFNTHAEVFALLFELNRVFRRVNLMSQRVDALVRTPGLVRAELAADKRSFTLGIEGVSRRMRAYFRKGLSDSDIAAAIEALLVRGVRELKLFYIVSGFEDEADLAEFASFAAGLGSKRAALAPGLRILASAGFLVRLPSTPLQYAPLCLDEPRLSGIADALRASCEASGMEFRLASHFDEYCLDQVLSLSDRRVSRWLAGVPSRGFCYDGSLSRGTWPSLAAFAKEAGILDDDFLGEKSGDWAPPLAAWDGAALRRQYEEARRFVDRPPCLGSGCSDCGACPDGEDRLFISGHVTRAAPDPAFFDRLSRLVAAKAAFPAVYVGLVLPDSLSGATAAYRSSWLMRRLSAASPGIESALFEAREALFSSEPLAGMLPAGFTGACVFALAGPSRERIREAAASVGLVSLEALPVPSRVAVEVEIPMPWAPDAFAAMRAWLAEERIDFIETRAGSARRLSPAARDTRKHILMEAAVAEAEGGAFRASLSLGIKARLPDWLGRLGLRALKSARVRVCSYD